METTETTDQPSVMRTIRTVLPDAPVDDILLSAEAAPFMAEIDALLKQRTAQESRYSSWGGAANPPIGGSDRFGALWSMKFMDPKTAAMMLDQSLDKERAIARGLWYDNTHYRGIIENIVNYVCGSSPRIGFSNADQEKKDNANELWRRLQISRRIDFGEKLREIVRRALRDGEVFVRRFKNPVDWRFISPEQVAEPSPADIAKITDEMVPEVNRSNGIETLANDAESVLAYWVNGERIPANEILHIKMCVDSGTKRGVPFLITATQLIRRYNTWLIDRIILNKIRTAIAVCRHRKNGEPGSNAAKVARSKTGELNYYDGYGTQRTVPTEAIFPGTTVNLSPGEDLEFKSPNTGADEAASDGRAILLAIAVGCQLPEFIVSGDASNNNFASALVSETPGVKAMESMQTFFFGKIHWLIWDTAIDAGIMTPDDMYDYLLTIHAGPMVVRDSQKEAQANEIKYRNGVISRRTWMERDGLDPDHEESILADEQTLPPRGAEFAGAVRQ